MMGADTTVPCRNGTGVDSSVDGSEYGDRFEVPAGLPFRDEPRSAVFRIASASVAATRGGLYKFADSLVKTPPGEARSKQ
jgi:hypothetical protein